MDGVLPASRFFLMISQDLGFLWDNRALNGDANPIEFPMRPVIDRYLPGDQNRLDGSGLELLVLDWLSGLARWPDGVDAEPERTLAHSGLLDSFKGGSVDLPPWP